LNHAIKIEPSLKHLKVLVENIDMDDHDTNNKTAIVTVTDKECGKRISCWKENNAKYQRKRKCDSNNLEYKKKVKETSGNNNKVIKRIKSNKRI